MVSATVMQKHRNRSSKANVRQTGTFSDERNTSSNAPPQKEFLAPTKKMMTESKLSKFRWNWLKKTKVPLGVLTRRPKIPSPVKRKNSSS